MLARKLAELPLSVCAVDMLTEAFRGIVACELWEIYISTVIVVGDFECLITSTHFLWQSLHAFAPCERAQQLTKLITGKGIIELPVFGEKDSGFFARVEVQVALVCSPENNCIAIML